MFLAARKRVIAGALLGAAACVDAPTRPGPTTPSEFPMVEDVAGTYTAVRLIVDRSGQVDDLLGDDDTRLDLRLNSDLSAYGQLKIGEHPALRTKQALVGTWRLALPALVTFDFGDRTFLDEVAFRAQPPLLTGDWLGEDLRIHLELKKVD